MKFLEFKNRFQEYIVFSFNDIKKLYPKFYRVQLNQWQDKGYIKKIINKYYIFSDLKINEGILFLIANKIYQPSYISLEMALYFYNLIPETVYSITSVSSKQTYQFESALGHFFYQKIKDSLMFGYQLMDFENHKFKIAEIEKALLDYFYLHPEFKDENDFFELRINKEEFFEKVDLLKFDKYLIAFNNKSLNKRMQKFLKFIKNA